MDTTISDVNCCHCIEVDDETITEIYDLNCSSSQFPVSRYIKNLVRGHIEIKMGMTCAHGIDCNILKALHLLLKFHWKDKMPVK